MKVRAPRLFEKHQGAKIALWYWLQGEQKQRSSRDSYTGEWDMGVDTIPMPERKVEDMEIVQIQLEIKRQGKE